jgi:uncharacterized protein with HEPN domain
VVWKTIKNRLPEVKPLLKDLFETISQKTNE